MKSIDARIDYVDPLKNGTLEASSKAICSWLHPSSLSPNYGMPVMASFSLVLATSTLMTLSTSTMSYALLKLGRDPLIGEAPPKWPMHFS
jgi:hypothetical protein